MTRYGEIKSQPAPQSEAATPEQVENNAGGFVFALDKWERLRRFLILGAEGGTYYATEREHVLKNVAVVEDCVKTDGARTLALVREIHGGSLAPKMAPSIFTLAWCLRRGDEATRRLAATLAPVLMRTGTQLLTLAGDVDRVGGWGRTAKRAFASWFTTQTVEALAMQVSKYASRGGWSMRDVLRLAHPKAAEPLNSVLRWSARGETENLPKLLQGVERVKRSTTPTEVAALISEYGLVREHVPTQHLDSPEVWSALLPTMPVMATIRNLGKMTSIGLLTPLSREVDVVVEKIEAAPKAKIHPFQILLALKTYAQGHGFKGSLSWVPDQQILAALDRAFPACFSAVKPSGKRIYIGLDVSGSMTSPLGNSPLTVREASSAMTLVTVRTEPKTHVAAFSNWMTPLEFSPDVTVNTITKFTEHMPFEKTDCALPMLDAIGRGIEVDAFVIYTDNETWAGEVHPFQALKDYRKKTGIAARLVVVGMTATEFTIADPSDAGMLDVVGFDASAPAVISEFIRGAI